MTAPTVTVDAAAAAVAAAKAAIEVALLRMGRTLKYRQDDGNDRIDERALLLELDYAVKSSGQVLRSFPASFRQLHDSATVHVAKWTKDPHSAFTYVLTSVQQTIVNSIKALANA